MNNGNIIKEINYTLAFFFDHLISIVLMHYYLLEFISTYSLCNSKVQFVDRIIYMNSTN